MEGESERDVWNWEERESFNREREWKSINSHKKRMVKHDRWRRSMVDKPLYKTQLSLSLSLYICLSAFLSLFLSLKGSCVNFQKPKQGTRRKKNFTFWLVCLSFLWWVWAQELKFLEELCLFLSKFGG